MLSQERTTGHLLLLLLLVLLGTYTTSCLRYAYTDWYRYCCLRSRGGFNYVVRPEKNNRHDYEYLSGDIYLLRRYVECKLSGNRPLLGVPCSRRRIVCTRAWRGVAWRGVCAQMT
ncbi:hypothetical protein LZ31DRAFT_160970 [Colletotrichum somersetense]|nr:hypothetical protein LZ31DRAFT_160970 [Colletotrichum somersetense]